MNISYHLNGVDYIKIESMYSDDEYSQIIEELTFFTNCGLFKQPEETGTASFDDGKPKKKNKAVFVDGIYADRQTSPILNLNRKLFGLPIDYDVLHPCFNAIRGSTHDSTLVSYYENADYYKPHFDESIITALTYFYKEPKKFSGGDLFFPRTNESIQVQNNTTYIFCGLEQHGATQILMEQDDIGGGNGRYAMAQFLNFCGGRK